MNAPQLRVRSAIVCEKPVCESPLLARIYAHRGVQDATHLRRELAALIPPAALRGVDDAAAVISAAIDADQSLLVIGDFDADGATSTALAVLGLRALGARQVDFLVPNRFVDGYGLTPSIVAQAVARGAQLIITVDNGIASNEGVAAANAAGVPVVVTDHHLPGETLPAAAAIVNPQQPGCTFPSKALAGVGVMFYVLMALRKYRGATQINLAEWLDIVALGTVADVVPLDSNNRILVYQGLQRIRAGKCRPGIRALLDVAKRARHNLTATDLAFALAPRLNAAGRLDDMTWGIRCLLAEHEQEAQRMAQELDRFNRERREIEEGMLEMADAALAQHAAGALPHALCLFEPDWHQGVIGIVAGRIKERAHRPTICFAEVEEGELKGSARSIPGVHIRDVLADIANTHPGLLHKFGGHAMAAGLSLPKAHFQKFSELLDSAVARVADEDTLTATLWSDGELADDEFTLDNALALREGGPWGQCFPEPLFHGEFVVRDQRWLAEKHCRFRLLTADGREVEGILFDAVRRGWSGAGLSGEARLSCTYRLDINHFNGESRLQLMVDRVV